MKAFVCAGIQSQRESIQITPMSCSVCATNSLRDFLGVFVGLDVQSAKPLRSLTSISKHRRSFQSNQSLCLKQSYATLDNPLLSNVASLTSLDDAFLPFDGPRDSVGTHGQDKLRTASQHQFRTALPLPKHHDRVGNTLIKESINTLRIGGKELEPQIVPLNPEKATTGPSEGHAASEKLRAVPKPRDSRTSSRSNDTKRRAPLSAKEPNRKLNHGDNGKRESWQTQKSALEKKFGSSGWTPRKRLSPDALEGIRALHAQYPDKYTTPVLAQLFEVSPENIRRILKSKWKPNEEEEASRRQRWDKRGEAIWSRMAELGVKPPKKWRQKGIGKDQVSFHKRSGHRFEKGTGTGGSAAFVSEGRTNPSLSERIL